MFHSLGQEAQAVVSMLTLLVPASFYILGLVEGKRGRYLFLIGLAFHLLGMALRGYELGTLPLTEKRDNISFMAFSTALVYYYFGRKPADVSPSALAMVSAFMFVAVGHRALNTISPFLKSPWFYLHMFLYFTSYGFFAVSACAGAHYVLTGRDEYEPLQYKTASFGWTALTLSLVAGSVWFYFAYGTYWLWTSRELWVTLMWFYFGLYLHIRHIGGLRGRPASIMGMLGLAVALFAYFGVGRVIPSPPTQF